MQYQQSVRLSGISGFGKKYLMQKGDMWSVRKITDQVLFSTHPGPWMLLERDHFQRWVNLSSDQNFLISWGGWINC